VSLDTERRAILRAMPGRGRRRWVLALGAALVVGAGAAAAIVLAAGGSGSEEDRATSIAQTIQEPLLVPRRRRPPTVVEPSAGGATAVPSAPAPAAPAPGARLIDGPSAGAPTDAELKGELAELKGAQAQYALLDLDFSGSLIDPSDLTPGVWRTSVASVYTDYFKPTACGGPLRPEQLGVAHKTLRCGTMVTFRYGNRAIRVPVIDRGPYIAGREWDFSGATATALRFPGLGPVQWRIG